MRASTRHALFPAAIAGIRRRLAPVGPAAVAARLAALAACLCFARAGGFEAVRTPPGAGRRVQLAGREVRRYVYLRTGSLPRLVSDGAAPAAGEIVVAVAGDAVLGSAPAAARGAGLGHEQFSLTSGANGAGTTWWIVGGDDQGALYGAYRFAETLGVRFYPWGDVISDDPYSGPGPLSETGKPVFAIRGFLPFNNFPEGPDWWGRDEYLAYVAQITKMRMNFMGWHDYPTHGSWANATAEPLVWMGLPRDLADDGSPLVGFPSSFFNSGRWSWEYIDGPTSAYSNGAPLLFADDISRSEVMDGLTPVPTTQPGEIELFNRVGGLLAEVVAEAKGLGVKTSIGTDTLYSFPDEVNQRLEGLGWDPASPAAMNEVYRGILDRVWRVAPTDYYWMWSPESWEWTGLTPADATAAPNNVAALVDASRRLGGKIQPMTAGWVLGPPGNESYFHALLPPGSPIASAGLSLGDHPLDLGYFAFDGRPKWFISWAERDTELTALQLWAGRTLYDAADARWAGCEGLVSLHWRTKAVSPNAAAQALASWDQSYVPNSFVQDRTREGALGGLTARTVAAIAGADVPAVYQTVRWGAFSYLLNVPSDTYSLTLKFAEPLYTQPGRRVFGVVAQGLTRITNLDVAARVGVNRALDITLTNVVVREGRLSLGFLSGTDYPMICGIVVSNAPGSGRPPFVRRIHCGGGAVGGYEADPIFADIPGRDIDRHLSPLALYTDFAAVNFGAAVAADAGALLASVDGRALPENPVWILGPGSLNPDTNAWEVVRQRYAFVDQFAALRGRVAGAASLERFDYWANMLRLQSAEAEAGCARGKLDLALAAYEAATTQSQRTALAGNALAARIALRQAWDRLMTLAVAIASNTGEIGTAANFETRSRGWNSFLGFHDVELGAALGRPLPDAVNPSTNFHGPERLLVTTARTLAHVGETYRVKAILLVTNPAPQPPVLAWRPLGDATWRSTPMSRVGRATFAVNVPAVTDDFEWRVQAAATDGSPLFWPAAGPPQTVVAWTPPRRPDPPSGLIARAGAQEILLGWTPAPRASAYSVKRSFVSGGPYDTIATNLTGASFADAPAPGQIAYYVVSSTTDVFESTDSAEIQAAIGAVAPPPLLINIDVNVGGAFSGQGVMGGPGLVWNEIDPATNRLDRLSDASGAATPVSIQWTGGYAPFAADPSDPMTAPPTARLLEDGILIPPNGVIAVILSGLPPKAPCRLVAYGSGPQAGVGARFSGAFTGAVTGAQATHLEAGVNYWSAPALSADPNGAIQFQISPGPGSPTAAWNGLQLQYSPPAARLPALLDIQWTAGTAVLRWPDGALYSSSSPAEPFLPVAGASSPFTIPPSTRHQFFQVRLPLK